MASLPGAFLSSSSRSIQLIERFYDPLAGEIFVRSQEIAPAQSNLFLQLDGERINELNIQEYRKQIALVSQEPTLYAGTVRFNILLGAVKPIQEVTQEEVEVAPTSSSSSSPSLTASTPRSAARNLVKVRR